MPLEFEGPTRVLLDLVLRFRLLPRLPLHIVRRVRSAGARTPGISGGGQNQAKKRDDEADQVLSLHERIVCAVA